MANVLVTGMSGSGKSTVIRLLGLRGHDSVDTDSDEWSRWTMLADGSTDWIWRDDAMTSLLTFDRRGNLFVAGCKTNQGDFYLHFDHIVLLYAPTEVLLARIAERSDNPYGKDEDERRDILLYVETVVPRLRASATIEIDSTLPVSQIVRQLEELS